MKKICFLMVTLLSVCVVSCKNGAEDNKNEVTPYPTYDTNKVEGKNSVDHPSTISGDTVH